MTRRTFIKDDGWVMTMTVAGGLVSKSHGTKAGNIEASLRDDELTTVVTSCAHNCGSRHVLFPHQKGDDTGAYQGDAWGTDTFYLRQLRVGL